MPKFMFLFILFILLLPVAINLGLGIHVWSRNPGARENRLLAMGCFCLSIYCFNIFETYSRPVEQGGIIYSMLAFGPLFATGFLSDFLLTISARPLISRRRIEILIIYGPMAFFSVLYAFTDWIFLGFEQTDSGEFVSLPGRSSELGWVQLIFMIGLILSALFQTIRTLFSTSDLSLRKQLLWSMSGIAVSILITLLIVLVPIPQFFKEKNWGDFFSTINPIEFSIIRPLEAVLYTSFCTTLIAGTMTYAIVRHGLAPSIAELVRQRNQALGERNQALEEANQRLQEMDRLKSDFVSNVSHDLRTPLTSIKGSVDNLLDGIAGELGDRQRRYIQRIKGNADRLSRLLELSRDKGFGIF